MEAFTFLANPARVIFGSGTILQIVEELALLGVKRPLVLSTEFQAKAAAEAIEKAGVETAGHFAGAAMHTPVSVTQEALAHYEAAQADGVISFGGGSTIGLGKAIALRNNAPQLVIPTTYAGSEMTAIVGQTENDRKHTQTTPKVLPETVIYDVDLTLTLPRAMSVTSGMNAIAHAVEAMYAQNANPILSLLAEEGIRALSSALDRIAAGATDNIDARTDALYGAWLCATCLGLGGVALHHKLCHVLGGSFGLPHAETHTIVLPHALAYNAPCVPQAMERLRRATGADNPASHLFDIAKRADVDVALKALDMPKDCIERAVDITLENPYFNPRPLEREPLVALLANAFEGTRPQ
ncbi:MAG: maleylacetate reductase [Erythrobacter sp.]|nr:maleylacetate reductase [Erythrobacter sp.]MDJ0979715.1 maleylacetate reductase [Erythrobacter sp.]